MVYSAIKRRNKLFWKDNAKMKIPIKTFVYICNNFFLLIFFGIERGLNEVQLPDQNMGVILYNGQMTGLDNLSRSGDALLEAATDHFLLSFSIEANDVKAKYWWKKQRLK